MCSQSCFGTPERTTGGVCAEMGSAQACGARCNPGVQGTELVAQQVAGWQQGQGGFAGPSWNPVLPGV